MTPVIYLALFLSCTLGILDKRAVRSVPELIEGYTQLYGQSERGESGGVIFSRKKGEIGFRSSITSGVFSREFQF